MTGTEVFIARPETNISDCVKLLVAHTFLSLNSPTRINPFDLPQVVDSDEADSTLRANPQRFTAFSAL